MGSAEHPVSRLWTMGPALHKCLAPPNALGCPRGPGLGSAGARLEIPGPLGAAPGPGAREGEGCEKTSSISLALTCLWYSRHCPKASGARQ